MSFGVSIARSAVTFQVAVIMAAMLFGALYPPSRGKMILVPVWPGAGHGMLALAIDRHALLVGSGPLPGSFVISGDRAVMTGAMLRHGVLVLAAPPAACGEKGRLA
jgi:hypothetical protein